MSNIPQAKGGLIGGSGDWGVPVPECLNDPEAVVDRHYSEGLPTPYGQTGPVKLLRICGAPVLRFPFHNWQVRSGNPGPPWVAADQVGYVLQEAGVEWVLVNGSVGGIQSPDFIGELPPWSVVITNDFIMEWFAPDPNPFRSSREVFPRIREPFCTALRAVLYEAALEEPAFTVYDHGVYICTPPDRFETPAEIRVLANKGGHIVGQTLGHEAPRINAVGAHLASLNIVSNHAEGHREWVKGGMVAFYHECALPVARTMIRAAKAVVKQGLDDCNCGAYDQSGLGVFPVENA